MLKTSRIELRDSGVDHVAMEVSSHALSQGRQKHRTRDTIERSHASLRERHRLITVIPAQTIRLAVKLEWACHQSSLMPAAEITFAHFTASVPSGRTSQ